MLSKSPEKEKFSMGGGKMRSASTYTGRSTFSARRPDLDDTNVAVRD